MSIVLDVADLFRQLTPTDDILQPLPADTITGHVHLYVNNLHTAMRFYSEVLGFQKQSMMPRYKMADTTLPRFNVHMIAFNTWKGENAQPAPFPALGMRYFTILTSQLLKIEESSWNG